METVRCIIEGGLGLLVLFFWAVSSRRFGAEVDTSLHPMRGGSGAMVHIFFAVITLALIGAVYYFYLR